MEDNLSDICVFLNRNSLLLLVLYLKKLVSAECMIVVLRNQHNLLLVTCALTELNEAALLGHQNHFHDKWVCPFLSRSCTILFQEPLLYDSEGWVICLVCAYELISYICGQ